MSINDQVDTFVVYRLLEGLEDILGCFRGKCWSLKIHIAHTSDISDIVGTWSHKTRIYILQKHPGLDMLSPEEAEIELVEDV